MLTAPHPGTFGCPRQSQTFPSLRYPSSVSLPFAPNIPKSKNYDRQSSQQRRPVRIFEPISQSVKKFVGHRVFFTRTGDAGPNAPRRFVRCALCSAPSHSTSLLGATICSLLLTENSNASLRQSISKATVYVICLRQNTQMIICSSQDFFTQYVNGLSVAVRHIG